jgi:polysaccharide deacetylase family protein (PEP-CTERM system associated)
MILSFDVEEHHRIEAAAGLSIPADVRAEYALRVEPATRWLLDELADRNILATFFVVGKLAREQPSLVRAIQSAGHEIASHGWDHRRVHTFNPNSFREDIRRSKNVLEQITSTAVLGYRAPTFSIVRETAWALDVLAEEGLLYDSSIYPVIHDRYGVPRAPRTPFSARGERHSIIEIPPATLRLLNFNVPAGGGGYFRLLPGFLLDRAINQAAAEAYPAAAMLYFHPWEFDPRQSRIPLGRINSFRTYVGIYRSRARLAMLLRRQRNRLFTRAVDFARMLYSPGLPVFDVAA